VAIVYQRAYYKKLPFYFVIKTHEPGIEIESDGDVWISNTCFIRKDKKGRPYIVPSDNGDHKIIHDYWSSDRNYEPTTYSKTAIYEAIGYSNGGGAGEYWAIVPKDAKDDKTVEELEVLENEL